MNLPGSLFTPSDAARANQDDTPLVVETGLPPARRPLGRRFRVPNVAAVPPLPGGLGAARDDGLAAPKTRGREIGVALLMLAPALIPLAFLYLVPVRGR